MADQLEDVAKMTDTKPPKKERTVGERFWDSVGKPVDDATREAYNVDPGARMQDQGPDPIKKAGGREAMKAAASDRKDLREMREENPGPLQQAADVAAMATGLPGPTSLQNLRRMVDGLFED